jgi:hypothetical protein
VAKDKSDDFEAVRTVVATLEPFDVNDQERILRWAREKLGLSVATGSAAGTSHSEGRPPRHTEAGVAPVSPASKATDIKSFIESKKPQTDMQFAAAAAYYYRFDAPEPQRKDAITPNDLQEACWQTGWDRLRNPGQTLINAHYQGYLDKGGDRGTYVINTVGENLVAMTLPDGTGAGSGVSPRGRKSRPKQKGGKKRRQ